MSEDKILSKDSFENITPENKLELGPKVLRIPDDWDKIIFDEVFTHHRGLNYSSQNYVKEGNGMVFFTLNSIASGGGLKKDSLKFYDDEVTDKKKTKPGDILLANTDLNQEGEIIGCPVKVPKLSYEKDFCFSHHLLKISQKKNKFNKQFLEYLFSSKYIHDRMIAFSCGSTVLNLSTNLLEKLELPSPPLPEQRKIATVLYTVDQAIQKTEEIIDQTERVKKGLMQDLLSEGIKDHDLKETDSRYGEIPENWDIKRINDIFKVIGGSTPSTEEPQYWNGEIPWATPTDITELVGLEIDQTERCITEEGLNSTSTHLLPPNSLLLTSRATIGECAVNTVEIATNQGFQNLVPKEDKEIDIWYTYYRIKETADYLESLGAGSTFSEISNSMVKKIKIPVPPLKEQKEIGKILRDIDRSRLEYIDQKEELQRLKKGLMQDLLTGKVRTKDKDIEVLDEVKEYDT